MLSYLTLTDRLRIMLEQLPHDSNKIIDDDIADELRDLCADRLDTHGFDINYNPTAEGSRLEALIDKLYVK